MHTPAFSKVRSGSTFCQAKADPCWKAVLEQLGGRKELFKMFNIGLVGKDGFGS